MGIPDTTTAGGRVISAVLLGCIFVGVVVRLVNARTTTERQLARVFARVGRLLITVGVLGTLLVFVSYENTPFLGARVWYAALGIGTLAWIGSIVYFVRKQLPSIREQETARSARDKYLPGRS